MTASPGLAPHVLPPWPSRMVDVGDMLLHVRRAEPDSPGLPPALFVHGLGGSAQNWTDLMGELRDVVDGEAVDLPGFGHSPAAASGDYSVVAHSHAVVRLLDARNRGPVHLFGNSLGGAVATRVAAMRPDLVRTLTLVSPALPYLRPRPVTAGLALYCVPGLSDVVGRWMVTRPPQQRVQAMLDLVYSDPGCVPEERRREAAADYARRDGLPYAQQALVGSLRGVLRAYLERGPGMLWRLAAQVRVPTLLIYGQRDKLVDVRSARRATATFPNARLLVLPACGHVAMMEHPAMVARAVRELLHAASAGVTAEVS